MISSARSSGLTIAAAAGALFLCGSALASPYPVSQPLGVRGHDGQAIPNAVALYDYEDWRLGITETTPDKITVGHLLPDRLSVGKNEFGEYLLQHRALYNPNGFIRGFLIDTVMEIQVSQDFQSQFQEQFKNAVPFFPPAESSRFRIRDTDDIEVFTSDDNGEESPVNDVDVLTTRNATAQMRIQFTRQGLIDYRCALQVQDAVAKEISRRGTKEDAVTNALSLVFGALNQGYDVVKYGPDFPVPPTFRSFSHQIRIQLDELVTHRINALVSLLVPRCLYQNADKITSLTGWPAQQQQAQQYGIDPLQVWAQTWDPTM